MLLDARLLEDDARLTADLCIVGAGAAGITLAREFAGTGLSVIVLAGGDENVNDSDQALYRGRMSGRGTWRTDTMRLRVFGGTTGIWSGWCRPLSPEDFEVREWMPESGWPFGYNELVPYYRRAAATVQIGGFDFDASVASKQLGLPVVDLDPDRVETRFYQFSPPTRFGQVYRDELEVAKNLSVYLRGHLLNVALDGAKRSVAQLDCGTQGGTRFTVVAGRYVMALGGLENPRMLLASNRQVKGGVANGNDLVGRFFMEHPHYLSSVGIVASRELFSRFYDLNEVDIPRDGESVNVRIRGGIGLSRSVRDADGIPNFTATVGSALLSEPLSGLGADAAGDVALRGGVDDLHLFRLTVRGEQTPDRLSRVTLQRDNADALGIPRLDLNWRIRRDDDVALRRGFEELGRVLGQEGKGRAWTPISGDRFDWTLSPGGHHMGTTRMHIDPARGVTDADCRCHEVDNLYCAGSSLFPTGGDANPTLTVVALAHRLADHLKGVV